MTMSMGVLPTPGQPRVRKQKRIQCRQEEISHEGLEAPRREREESGSSCTGLPSRLVLCHDADLRLRPACYGRAGVWLDVRKNPDVLLVLSIAIWGSLVYEGDTFVKFISLRVPLRCFCALQTSAFGRNASPINVVSWKTIDEGLNGFLECPWPSLEGWYIALAPAQLHDMLDVCLVREVYHIHYVHCSVPHVVHDKPQSGTAWQLAFEANAFRQLI